MADSMFGGSGAGDISEGLGGIFSGLFSNSDKPYKKAGETLRGYLDQGQKTQNPFYQAGTSAIPQRTDWVNSMKDPSGFINKLMSQYSESPWAKFQQEQSGRAFANAGSASGLTGSTPLAQFEQKNMHDLTSQDQQQWLANVLGINTEYGKGLGDEIQTGQHSADQITELLKSLGLDIAGTDYNQEVGKNKDRNDLWGGIFKTGEGAAKMYAGM